MDSSGKAATRWPMTGAGVHAVVQWPMEWR